MSNLYLVLEDGTEIPLESSHGINALYVLVEDKDAACELWKKLSKENLQDVTVRTAEGSVDGNYSDMVLDHIEGRERKNGAVQMMLCLRSKNEKELFEERIVALESGLQMRDETIAGMAEELTETQMALTEVYEAIGGAE